jgi:hypothetical protein
LTIGHADFVVQNHDAGSRREFFVIAHNERLIGCILDITEKKFWGITEF